ncbi:MAG: YgaP family membrane protein [Chitinophagaceae bacterium]
MKNVGKSDRSVRIVIGVLIAVAGIYFKSWWGIVAILPLVTAFTGFCPLYKVLGITTRKTVVE